MALHCRRFHSLWEKYVFLKPFQLSYWIFLTKQKLEYNVCLNMCFDFTLRSYLIILYGLKFRSLSMKVFFCRVYLFL